MTVLALFLTPDLITLAADSISVRPGGAAATHHPKLQVNQLARIACAGTGFAVVLHPAYAVCAEACSFDAALPKVTQALRRSVRDSASVFDDEPRAFACQTFVMAGWSEDAGRMVAYSLCGWSYFAPILATQVTLPEISGLPELWRPRTLGDLVRLCSEQADILTATSPRAGEGTLQVCEMTRHETKMVSFPDYHTYQESTDGLL